MITLKVKDLTVLMISVAALVVGLTLIFYSTYVVYKVQKIDMRLQTGDKIGFDVDDQRLNFGRLIPGGGGSRELRISNDHLIDLKVSFKKEGNISQFVEVPNSFWLPAGEQLRSVSINTKVPFGAEVNQSYRGTLKVVFTRI